MSKTVLVTGTSSGFGKDIALTLAHAGHRVFGTMRGVNSKHSGPAKELQAAGIEVIELDVTKDASVDNAIDSLFSNTGGKLDVVINNAGALFNGISETITSEQTLQMFDVNVVGIQRVLRAVLPNLRKNKDGLVINVGSILGRVTIPFMGLYGASKFAVEALTDSYRYELSQLGVDVVLVQPGPYPTNLYSEVAGDDATRANEYGPVAEIPKAFGEFLSNLFSSHGAPDPHDVSTGILRLIETPAGHRPARLVVGLPFGADAANAAIEPIQNQLIEGVQMEGLKVLKTA
ncbi:SDR family oxidoreductase [Acidipila sp. EB88]|uniref:SDR family oxidoreductase n=1 Tax=Acidipila sp. EB88 TaxID=2305226 RepID=UPI000F602E3E|nr:SDR family oxidoreductase [Acidipila sp. EB88]RRA50209.1 SDR family oxidoreductase [Acidipila sp. EB88]